MANSQHVRLFDCLRVISGNQVLDGQELPCNNYGVKWQLATQEGICLLAAPSCSVSQGQRSQTFQEKSISQAPWNRWRPGQPCLLKQLGEKWERIRLVSIVGFLFDLLWAPTRCTVSDKDSLTSSHNTVISESIHVCLEAASSASTLYRNWLNNGKSL